MKKFLYCLPVNNLGRFEDEQVIDCIYGLEKKKKRRMGLEEDVAYAGCIKVGMDTYRAGDYKREESRTQNFNNA